MRRTVGTSLLLATIVFGFTVFANEKPTAEFQELMKASLTAIGGKGLRGHFPKKDYDGIAKDAAILKAMYLKMEPFWTQRKADDAIKFSRTGLEAVIAMEVAAKAKDDKGILSAEAKMMPTCAGCHDARRVDLGDGTYLIK